VLKKHNAPRIKSMNFEGDTLMVLMFRGRTTGADKKIGKTLSNIALIPLIVLSGGKFQGINVRDRYSVSIAAFSIKNGTMLMKNSIGVTNLNNLIDSLIDELDNRIFYKKKR